MLHNLIISLLLITVGTDTIFGEPRDYRFIHNDLEYLLGDNYSSVKEMKTEYYLEDCPLLDIIRTSFKNNLVGKISLWQKFPDMQLASLISCEAHGAPLDCILINCGDDSIVFNRWINSVEDVVLCWPIEMINQYEAFARSHGVTDKHIVMGMDCLIKLIIRSTEGEVPPWFGGSSLIIYDKYNDYYTINYHYYEADEYLKSHPVYLLPSNGLVDAINDYSGLYLEEVKDKGVGKKPFLLLDLEYIIKNVYMETISQKKRNMGLQLKM